MDAAGLRATQAPLKTHYLQEPDSAAVPLTAHGTFRADGLTCTVDGFAGPVRAGMHPAVGGASTDACSGDMLLEAVLACAGVTLRSVATVMGLDLSDVALVATAMFDARGTLGIDREVPVGIQDLAISIDVSTTADESSLERLAQMTERYCVVGQSLASPPSITIRNRSAAGTER